MDEVNLVSARSAVYSDRHAFSRSASAQNYAKTRQKHQRHKHAAVAISSVLGALIIAAVATLAVYFLFIKPTNDALHTSLAGDSPDFNSSVYQGVFSTPQAPEDPFYMLLLGTDGRPEDTSYRSDTIILARIDPKNKQVALISIPRDSRVQIPGYGLDKINAAYAYGMIEHINYENGKRTTDNSGPAMAVKTVSQFAGVNISYFAEIDFNGFQSLVDSIGGVYVDVPVAIKNDPDSGGIDIDTGYQQLDGAQALAFVRSRKFPGYDDYQRQADQRIFLQALAAQILASDPVTITKSVGQLANMTYTNMNVQDIAAIAVSLRGMQENGIYTYSVPSTTQTISGVSYVIPDTTAWQELMASIDSGIYPTPASGERYQAVSPDSYNAWASSTDSSTGGSVDQSTIQQNFLNNGLLDSTQTPNYTVTVRNGCGTAGAATAVSDLLVLAGYKKGDVGNTNSYVYDQTLIIYKNDSDKAAADDINARLGYGTVIPSAGRYTFTGNVLVVVGGDFPYATSSSN
ncbi:MAG: LCP family protein [Coriobacteriia bacterium]|nr:LCP family protein [Coriobacteriia bacterium]